MNSTEYFQHTLRAFTFRLLNEIRPKSDIKLCAIAGDHIGDEIFVNGLYEHETLDAVRRLLLTLDLDMSNKIALDIGANIGNHAIYLSKIFSEVLCFEPNSDISDILEANIKLNKKRNIQLIRAAVVEQAGNYCLIHEDGNLGATKLVQTKETAEKVNTVTGDEVEKLVAEKIIGFIKIDTEGFEFSVLKSLKKILINQSPLVALEQHENEIFDGSSQCLSYLKSLGYTQLYAPITTPSHNNATIQFFLRLLKGKNTEYRKSQSLEKRFHPLVILMK